MSKRESIWLATAPSERYPSLDRDLTVDVAVVGGGITGLSCAALLARAGKRVAVIEQSRIGGGVSGGTTAHLATVPDWGYSTIESKFGRDGAKLTRAAMGDGVAIVERLARELAIECSFARVPGYYYPATEADRADVESEYDAATRAGHAASLITDMPLAFAPRFAAKFEQQGRFHVLAYLHGLARYLRSSGMHVLEQTHVTETQYGDPCRVVTERGVVTAQQVVLATHSPIGLHAVHTEIAPYRSYALAAKVRQPVADALYWDTAQPYNYIRLQPAGTDMLVIIGGQDHKTGHDDELLAFERLERYTRDHFEVIEIANCWSAQYFDPSDGLPLIGASPGSANAYIATGFSGDGMTFGSVSGEIITNLILGHADPRAELFKPSRVKPLAGAAHFVKENVDVALRFVLDRLPGAQRTELEELPAGQGRVVQIDHKKVAAYRDDSGGLHLMSAVCPHMKCIVRFNPAERSWDCPCHGSRFSAVGAPLDAPTTVGLTKINHG
jgi:glycine/D-amino acid oxidase-like deaminating enzyme/nitrite reductase/ring-hydroxylating ferredoxin subunit